LLYFRSFRGPVADAERICFTDLPEFSVGNLCFCIRQLRQTISHHLLFQTFHPMYASTVKKPLIPEFIEHEPGFTKIVLLRDVLDWDDLQPSAVQCLQNIWAGAKNPEEEAYWIKRLAFMARSGRLAANYLSKIPTTVVWPKVTTVLLCQLPSDWSRVLVAQSSSLDPRDFRALDTPRHRQSAWSPTRHPYLVCLPCLASCCVGAVLL
jgi:hypothetical protein